MLEYDWPLNDLELEETVLSLVLATKGDAITPAALEQVGFYAAINSWPRNDEIDHQEPARRRRNRAATHATKPGPR
jgi:DNA-binding NtrC family response regulator